MKSKFIYVLLILFLVPITFINAHSEGWAAPEDAKKVINPVKSDSASIEKGAKIYKEKCLICHGEKGDGKGTIGANLVVKPTDFTNKNMMDSMTDGEIFWKISNGKGPMPSWKDKIKDNEIWDVVNYIKTFVNPSEK